MPLPEDSTSPLSAEAASELLVASRRAGDALTARYSRRSEAILACWGSVWLVGFGALWVSEVSSVVDRFVALSILAIMSLLAIAVTIWVARRHSSELLGRGRRDNDRSVVAWVFAIVAGQVFTAGLYPLGVNPDTVLLVVQPAVVSIGIGLVLLTYGLTLPAGSDAIAGGVLIAVGAAAPFVPVPLNLALFSLVGGGGMLVLAGASSWQRIRRERLLRESESLAGNRT